MRELIVEVNRHCSYSRLCARRVILEDNLMRMLLKHHRIPQPIITAAHAMPAAQGVVNAGLARWHYSRADFSGELGLTVDGFVFACGLNKEFEE